VTRLRKMMLEELQRRNYSEITTRKCLKVVSDFAKHFGKSPDKLGPNELRSYQPYLLKERKLTPGSAVVPQSRSSARTGTIHLGQKRVARLPGSSSPCWAEQTHYPTHFASQLGDTFAGSWHRPAHHPGSARSRRPGDYRSVFASVTATLAGGHESAGQPLFVQCPEHQPHL
jgi:hypothetical protein